MKNLLIITYWSYKDALIQTYTLPYVKIIRKNLPAKNKIYLFTIEQDFFRMTDAEWQQEKERLQQENIYLIRFKYSKFGIKMMFKFIWIFISLFTLIIFNRVSKIHTWCTPAGAIGYILSVFAFKPLIIDSFEPHAMPMLESGTWTKESLSFKLLFKLEKLQAKKAKYVIACVSKMKDYAQKTYNIKITNFYSKPSCVDTENFNTTNSKKEYLLNNLNLNDKIICVYSGKFGGLYLEKETFDFFKICGEYWGERFHVLLLTNHSNNEIKNYCMNSNFNYNKITQLFVEHKEIHNYLGIANFAINPTRPISSRRYGTPIKTGEYWAIGLPVIITKDISDDSDIIEKEDIGYVLKELNEQEYFNAIKEIDDLLKQDKNKLRNKIRKIAIKYRSFTIAEEIYNEIYGNNK